MALEEQKAIVELTSDMKYVVKTLDEIKTNMVHKSTHEALEKRVEKLEHAPWRTISIILSAGSTLGTILVALYTILHK